MLQNARRPVPAAMADRLIVALDVPSIAQARDLVARIGDAVGFYKVGYSCSIPPAPTRCWPS